MKKYQLFWIVALFILLSLPIQAKRVNVETAEKAARSYANAMPQLASRSDFLLSHSKFQSLWRSVSGLRNSTQEDEPMYYVFTMNDNGGFIIIAGDDAVKPVLGYSDTGTFDESNPNLAYWMETLSQEIAAAIENNLLQDAQTQEEWEALNGSITLFSTDEATDDYVLPLIQTQWNQNYPYYIYCPKERYTGCVATAMAQIMKYHNHPENRTVVIPAYTTATDKIYVPSVNGDHSYRWHSMTNIYQGHNERATETAVAELMRDCGFAVKMDYQSTGSSAYSHDVPSALKNYFDYDAGVSYFMRDYYSLESWINLLKTELNDNRPVYYSGQGSVGGHAFVCDGYNAAGQFHFNWGWGGNSDGYFAISALNPGSLGAGGGAGSYNSEQSIVTNIQPAGGNSIPQPAQFGLSSVSATKSRNTITITTTELMNISATTITNPYLGVLLCNADNSYRDHKTSQQNFSLAPGYYYPTRTLLPSYSLPSGLPAGEYKLYPAFGFSSGIPAVIRGKNGVRYIPITVSANGSISLHNSVTEAGSDISSGLTGALMVGESSSVTVGFSAGTLYIDSPAAERIEVYSISGKLLHRVNKRAGKDSFTIPNSERLLIVRGSSGWVKKIEDM
ncbi:MAG: C10 family peptidase [Dysgonamonadaceae bacterium]|nr:C10 family peptidase [Dysgonamonadaceae bacterium]